MTIPFSDRVEAGRELAGHLGHLAGRDDVVVLGLPRGGVPVAFEVARALGAALDVFVVRKLGVPGQEELAMGAVASGGVRALNADIVGAIGISREALDQVTAREQQEVARRERAYRGDRPFPALRNATVLLVDDGVATGATMLAGVRALRQFEPRAIVAAAPVMSESARTALLREADACVTVATPEPFMGVGAWYRNFTQTSDAEVLDLLERAAAKPGQEPAHARHS
jgi:predicted phosphoribosyltransferase